MSDKNKPTFEALEERVLLSGSPIETETAIHAAANFENVAPTLAVTEIFVVDTSVDNYEDLLSSFDQKSLDIHFINSAQDGVNEITSILSSYKNLAAVHILSHGSDGQIKLGHSVLSSESLSSYSSELQSWSSALSTDADILIYGCNVGQDTAFIEEITSLTGADVAASDDITGVGGDAELEIQIGSIETATIFTQEQLQTADISLGTQIIDDAAISGLSDADITALINTEIVNAGVNGTVEFQLSSDTIINLTSRLEIRDTSKNLTITSTGAGKVTIDSTNNTSHNRHVQIFTNSGDITFNNLRFQNVAGRAFNVDSGVNLSFSACEIVGSGHLIYSSNTSSTTTITDSTFSGIPASGNFGFLELRGTSTISNSTFYATAANSNLIKFVGGSHTVSNSTLVATGSSSFTFRVYNGTTDLTLTSSIIAGNLGLHESSSLNAATDYSFWTDGTLTGGANNLTGTLASLNLDTGLKDNGGSVQTLALLTGSAAIDAGTGTGTDARGEAISGSARDIGAFEYEVKVAPNVVITDADLTGLTDADITALINTEIVNAGVNGTVEFQLTSDTTINLTSRLEIRDTSKNLTITSTGAGKVTIDSTKNTSDNRHFQIFSNSGDITFHNLTFQNVAGRAFNADSGVNLSFSACEIVGSGHQIYESAASSTTTITDSTFSGTPAAGTEGFLELRGTSIISNSTFYTTATSSNLIKVVGGAHTISNSTLVSTGASSFALRSYNGAADTTFTNSLIAGTIQFNEGSSLNNATDYSFLTDLALSTHNASVGTNNLTGTLASLNLDTGLKDNGGPVQTLALLTGSAAIDAGTGTGADARGNDPQGARDIGAYEFLNPAPVLTLTPVAITEGLVNSATVVATFTVTDNDTPVISIENDPNGYFVIDGTTVKLTAAGVNAVNDDALALTSLSLTIAADDSVTKAVETEAISINRVAGTTTIIRDADLAGKTAAEIRNFIQDKITAAGVDGKVDFQLENDHTIMLTNRLNISSTSKNLTITNTGAGQLIFDSTNNTANRHFQIFSNSGDITFHNLTFQNVAGRAFNVDGGVNLNFSACEIVGSGHLIYSSNSSSTTTITDSTFSGTPASGNGGFIELRGTNTISNSTFYATTASSNLIKFVGGSHTVSNSTLVATGSSSFTFRVYNGATDLTLTSSIIAGNLGLHEGSSLNTATDYSFWTDGTLTGGANNLTGTLASLNLDTGLKDNGGPVKTLAILAGSAAINEGDPTISDFTGQNGVTETGFGMDIGAFQTDSPENDGDSTIDSGASASAAEGSVVSNTLKVSDVDGNTNVSFALTPGQTITTGTPEITTAGLWKFTPADPNWAGTQSFTVDVTDDEGFVTSLTIEATVNPVDDGGSVAISSDGTTLVGDVLTATVTDAVEGIDNSVAIVYEWKAGTTVITGETGQTLALTDAFVGQTITVTATYKDGQAFVTSPVSSPTAAVIAVDDGASVATGGLSSTVAEGINPSNTLAVTDADGVSSGAFSINTQSALGVATIDQDGLWEFVPNDANWSGQTTFTVNVTDDQGFVTTLTITAEVTSVNDAALATTGNHDLAVDYGNVTVSGQLTNTDVDNKDNVFQALTETGAYGTLVFNTDGSYTYTADSSFEALPRITLFTDVFTVLTEDGTETTITINLERPPFSVQNIISSVMDHTPNDFTLEAQNFLVQSLESKLAKADIILGSGSASFNFGSVAPGDFLASIEKAFANRPVESTEVADNGEGLELKENFYGNVKESLTPSQIQFIESLLKEAKNFDAENQQQTDLDAEEEEAVTVTLSTFDFITELEGQAVVEAVPATVTMDELDERKSLDETLNEGFTIFS